MCSPWVGRCGSDALALGDVERQLVAVLEQLAAVKRVPYASFLQHLRGAGTAICV